MSTLMKQKIRREIAVHVDPVEDLGPKMRALNERQRAFVTACLEIGRVDNKRAAAMAGYSGDDNTLAVAGHRLSHTLSVQEAMHEEASRRLGSAKIMAVSELIGIAQSSGQVKDRLKAISMILNRTGLHETSEHKVTTRDESKTDEAMLDRINVLAAELGVDVSSLVGKKVAATLPLIEGEFEEVAMAEGEGSAEGLEDLL